MTTLRDILEISHSDISVMDGTCPIITINPRINIDECFNNKFLEKEIEEVYVNDGRLLVYIDDEELNEKRES